MNSLCYFRPFAPFAPFALLAVLAGCDSVRSTLPTAAPSDQAGGAGARLLRAGADSVPGRYIVAFRRDRVSSAALTAGELVPAHHGRLHFTYEHALKGFAADLSPDAVKALLRDPRVAYVVLDSRVKLSTTQTGATWGLDRIDQRDLPLNGEYTYTRTGTGVTAYVIDSGILTSHTEFEGRATVGTDLVGDGQDGQDCDGHGTHVAGTLGGATYGVAKQVNLVAVRVFDCAGNSTFSIVIAGVDWVTANAVKPAVVNMSLGGGYSAPTNEALQTSIASGLTYVVAAGNEESSACGISPASTPEAITVASSAMDDTRSWFSNFGPCVDLFAPGSDITSAWPTSNTATSTISGTSMASPHVAGVAALYLEGNPAAVPAQVANAVLNSTSSARLADPYGSPNLLLFSPLTPEPFHVTGVLEFGLLRTPGCCSSAGAAGPGGSGARQAFTGSGTGAVKSERATSAAGDVAAEAGTTTRTLTLTNNGASPLAWSVADSVAWLAVSPAGGTLAARATKTLDVTVDPASLPLGDHQTYVVVTAGSTTRSVPVAVTVEEGIRLENSWPEFLAGEDGSRQFFVMSVPAGVDSLVIEIIGEDFDGDADLYVRRGQVPNYYDWDCAPFTYYSTERCVAVAPAADDYFIMVYAYEEFVQVELRGSFSVVPTAPLAAGDVVATATGSLRVDVDWRDNSGDETLFRVRRSTRSPDDIFPPYEIVGSLGPNQTSFTDSTVAPGATYLYKVQACNDLGCSTSAPSPVVTVVLPPGPPTHVETQVSFGPRVELSWSDTSGMARTYHVRRSVRNPDGSYTPYDRLRVTNATTYSDTSVVPGQRYRYQVRACNDFGCATSTAVSAYVPPLPAVPTGVGANVVTANRIDVVWTDASSDESSFQVRRSRRNPDGTFAPAQTIATLPAGSTSFADTGVTPGNAYRYQVRACALGCATSGAVVITVPSPPVAPAGVRARAVSPSQVNVGWTDVSSNESSFRVRRTLRKPDGTFAAFQTIGTVGAGVTSYTDSTVIAGQTYRYLVQACNVGGCGSSSSVPVHIPPS
jgi:aqualysin 1